MIYTNFPIIFLILDMKLIPQQKEMFLYCENSQYLCRTYRQKKLNEWIKMN